MKFKNVLTWGVLLYFILYFKSSKRGTQNANFSLHKLTRLRAHTDSSRTTEMAYPVYYPKYWILLSLLLLLGCTLQLTKVAWGKFVFHMGLGILDRLT